MSNVLLTSTREAREYWKEASQFWSIFEEKALPERLWQIMLQLMEEVGNYEEAVSSYSIDHIDYKIEYKWKKINWKNKLGREVIDIPYLTTGVSAGTVYKRGEDYTIEDRWIVWSTDKPSQSELYAPSVYEKNPYVEKYFNNGFFNIEFAPELSEEIKLELIKHLWLAYGEGPTRYNVWSLVNHYAGAPFPKYVCKMLSSTEASYLVPAYLKKIDGYTIIASSKVNADVTISEANGLYESSETLNLGDILVINNKIYRCFDDSNHININFTGSFTNVNIYTPHNKDFLYDCMVYDDRTGNIFTLEAEKYPDYLVYLVDRRNVVNGEIKAKKGNILNNTGEFDLDNHTGEVLPAYYPLSECINITGWDESVTSVPDVTNKMKYIYHGEESIIYSPRDIQNNRLLLEKTDNLEENNYIAITSYKFRRYEVAEIDVTADGYYVIGVDDNGEHKFFKKDVVYVCSSTNQYSKKRCVIINGEYDYGQERYYFTLDGNIGNITNPYLRVPVKQRRNKKIESIDGNSVEINGQIDVDISEFPCAKKLVPGELSLYNMAIGIAEAEKGKNYINVSLETNEVDNYIALTADNTRVSIYKIVEQEDTRIYLDNKILTNYSGDNCYLVLLRRLPAHSHYQLSAGYIGGLRELKDILPAGVKIDRTGEDERIWVTEEHIPVLAGDNKIIKFKVN